MGERAGIQSVEVGFALLDVLAQAPGPLMLRDLALVLPEFVGEPGSAVDSPWIAVADYGNARIQIFELDGTLVGVIDADVGLNSGDPRAAERTFQLLQQVTGRAGRFDKPGRGMLQTYQPDHPVIRALLSRHFRTGTRGKWAVGSAGD